MTMTTTTLDAAPAPVAAPTSALSADAAIPHAATPPLASLIISMAATLLCVIAAAGLAMLLIASPA